MNKSDIKRIESVQRRATRIVFETRSLEYAERLKELNLTNLELRRQRGDLIQVYKIFKKIDDIKINIGLVTQNRVTQLLFKEKIVTFDAALLYFKDDIIVKLEFKNF